MATQDPDHQNQTSSTGPNSQPTAPVPYRWIANSPTRIPSEIGTTRWRQRRRRDLEPLHGGRDGDRRRDHSVAEEQARPEDPERDQQCGATDPAALDQRGQRHDAAVAPVVDAHQHDRVLERDDDHQRPEDQRDDPVDAGHGGVRRVGVLGEDDLLGVQRTGSDVAVDDAQRAQAQHDPARVGDDISLAVLVAGARATVGRRRHRRHRPMAQLVGDPVAAGCAIPITVAIAVGAVGIGVELVGGFVQAPSRWRRAHGISVRRTRLPRPADP